ncbi:unnamed protein product, partial [Ceratitis capitata]
TWFGMQHAALDLSIVACLLASWHFSDFHCRWYELWMPGGWLFGWLTTVELFGLLAI